MMWLVCWVVMVFPNRWWPKKYHSDFLFLSVKAISNISLAISQYTVKKKKKQCLRAIFEIEGTIFKQTKWFLIRQQLFLDIRVVFSITFIMKIRFLRRGLNKKKRLFLLLIKNKGLNIINGGVYDCTGFTLFIGSF